MKKRIITYTLTLVLLLLALTAFKQKQEQDRDLKIGVVTSNPMVKKSYLMVYDSDFREIKKEKINEGGIGMLGGEYARAGDEIFLSVTGTKRINFNLYGMVSIDCANSKITKYPVTYSEKGKRTGTQAVAVNTKYLYSLVSALPGEILMRDRQGKGTTLRWAPDDFNGEAVAFLTANDRFLFVGTNLPENQTTGLHGSNLYILDAATLAVVQKMNFSAEGNRIRENYLLTEEGLYFEMSEEKPLTQRQINDIKAQYGSPSEEEAPEEERGEMPQGQPLSPILRPEMEDERQNKPEIPTTYSYYRLMRIDLKHFYKEAIEIGTKGVGGIAPYQDKLLIISDYNLADSVMVYDKKEKRKVHYELTDWPQEICVAGDRGYLLGLYNGTYYLSEIDLTNKPLRVTRRRKLDIAPDQTSAGMYVFEKEK